MIFDAMVRFAADHAHAAGRSAGRCAVAASARAGSWRCASI